MMLFHHFSRHLSKLSNSRVLIPFPRAFHSSIRNQNVHGESRTVFSGIQPTGGVHIGNYLGAIRKWVDLQNRENDVIYCIVDLHAITLEYDHTILYENILSLTATLIACGIDPDKSILFQQSDVSAHSELCWILSCLTTMPRLSQLPQYKEKSEKFTNKSIPTSLFIYPILQAADILLYKTNFVPVGEDQAQHIQLAAHLAKIFNGKYGDTFPSPRSMIYDNKEGRIKSLKDPTKKMSKSDPNPKATIGLTDSPKEITEKVKKSITDFTSAVYYDQTNRPGVSNLMSIHSAITSKSFDEIKDESMGIDTGQYKGVVADALIEFLTPIRENRAKLLEDRGFLARILKEGGEKAKARAEETMCEVRKKVGFR